MAGLSTEAIARLGLARDAVSRLELLVQTADAWAILGDAILVGLSATVGGGYGAAHFGTDDLETLRNYASSDAAALVETERGRAAVRSLVELIERRG